MKPIIITIAAIATVFITGFLFSLCPCNHEYIGYVKGVTGETVTVMTEDGHVWRFSGRGFDVNDMVELTIFDNDTADKGADVIVKVKAL